jgi:tripartite-type tricarboxylate transporter receptor subunit TctC
MKMPRRELFHLAVGAIALPGFLAATGRAARSQTARTIKIVVPFPAGGAADVLARLLADEIAGAHGLTTIIENRPGASSVIATELASRAPPDGNTVLMLANSFVINPHLRKLNYDPLTSFAPICYLARSPTLLAVNSASPYRRLADLLDDARARPGALTLASVGPATSFHIAIEALKRAAGVNLTYVPYPGDPPAVNALLGGHVTALFANYVTVVEHLKAGSLRGLATGSPQRIEQLPQVPTIAESGYQDYEVETWFGAVVPAKTPNKAVAALSGWYAEALQVPSIRAKLAAQGLFPVGVCGQEFAAFISKQYRDYGAAIRAANIKAE